MKAVIYGIKMMDGQEVKGVSKEDVDRWVATKVIDHTADDGSRMVRPLSSVAVMYVTPDEGEES